jgi:hypothetical protein
MAFVVDASNCFALDHPKRRVQAVNMKKGRAKYKIEFTPRRTHVYPFSPSLLFEKREKRFRYVYFCHLHQHLFLEK